MHKACVLALLPTLLFVNRSAFASDFQTAVPKFYETVLYVTAAQMAELYQNVAGLQPIGRVTITDPCKTVVTPDCQLILGGRKTRLVFSVEDGGHHPTGNSYQFVASEENLGDIDFWMSVVENTQGRDAVSTMLVGAGDDNVPYDRGFLIEVPAPTPDYVSIVRFHTFEYEPDYLAMTYPDRPEVWGIRREQVMAAKGLYDPALPLLDYTRSISRMRPEQITRYAESLQALGISVLGQSDGGTEMTDGEFLYDLLPITGASSLEGTERMVFAVKPGAAWSLNLSFFKAQVAAGSSDMTIDFDLGAFQP